MKFRIVFFIASLSVFAWACQDKNEDIFEETPEAPFNPFDTIDYTLEVTNPDPVDSASFLGIHQYILAQTCNQPGCHDGSFEPDFRTVQSSYNTLVYHPVFKNYDPQVDGQPRLPARVVPGDPDRSMLYHRVAYDNPPGFEQMPATGIAIPDSQIGLIRQWIEGGATDAFGNPSMATSSQPNCYGVLGFLPNLGNIRVDTVRGGGMYNPFVTLVNQDITLWFLYGDNALLGEFSFGDNLGYNKIKLSLDRLDFGNAVELDMEVPDVPLEFPSVYSEPFNAFPIFYTQRVTFNPAALGFESGDVVYIRTYVQDDDHEEPTEIPELLTNFLLKNYFAFYIN